MRGIGCALTVALAATLAGCGNETAVRPIIPSQSSQSQSTINLILASPILHNIILSCQIHGVEHSSDHHSIESTFSTHVQDTFFEPCLLFRNAS